MLHSICIGLLSHCQRVKYPLALLPLVLEAQSSHLYAAVALLIARVQYVFRADKAVLPSVSPTHAAHFCMFINVLLHVHQHTAAYSSTCGIHWVTPQYCLHTSKTALLKPSFFTLKFLPFHPQILSTSRSSSVHCVLKLSPFHAPTSVLLSSHPHPFTLVVLLFSSFCNRPTSPPCNPRNTFQFSLPICRTYVEKAFFPFCRTIPQHPFPAILLICRTKQPTYPT